MPPEFDLKRAAIAQAPSAPPLVLDGPSGKRSAAGVGAAKGGGIGFLIGGLACLGAGPLAPVCLATMVPAGAAIGAASGAVAGAMRADGADEVQAKRDLLQPELAAISTRNRLATQLQQKLIETQLIEVPIVDTTVVAIAPQWTLRLGMNEVGTLGSGPGATYALQSSASLTVSRAGDAQPAFVKHYRATSSTKMTTADWSADDGAPVRIALRGLSADLATLMAADLSAGPEAKTPRR